MSTKSPKKKSETKERLHNAIFYARISESNKKWLQAEAKKNGFTSVSQWFDNFVNMQRKLKKTTTISRKAPKNASKKKQTSKRTARTKTA